LELGGGVEYCPYIWHLCL